MCSASVPLSSQCAYCSCTNETKLKLPQILCSFCANTSYQFVFFLNAAWCRMLSLRQTRSHGVEPSSLSQSTQRHCEDTAQSQSITISLGFRCLSMTMMDSRGGGRHFNLVLSSVSTHLVYTLCEPLIECSGCATLSSSSGARRPEFLRTEPERDAAGQLQRPK